MLDKGEEYAEKLEDREGRKRGGREVKDGKRREENEGAEGEKRDE